MTSADPGALLRQFAPVMYLTNEEQHFPSSIAWYLNNVQVTQSNGSPFTPPAGTSFPDALADASMGERLGWRMTPLNTATTYAGQGPAGATSISTEAYGYVRPVAGSKPDLDLLYWFLFAARP